MSRKNTFQLCLLALSTALIIVSSQLAVPLPGGVPFTLQTLVIPLIAAAFGWQLGTGAVALYLLLGAAGLPVFSGASGGIAVLFGPNGGFLWAFLPLALITGLAKGKRFYLTLAAGIALSWKKAGTDKRKGEALLRVSPFTLFNFTLFWPYFW